MRDAEKEALSYVLADTKSEVSIQVGCSVLNQSEVNTYLNVFKSLYARLCEYLTLVVFDMPGISALRILAKA